MTEDDQAAALDILEVQARYHALFGELVGAGMKPSAVLAAAQRATETLACVVVGRDMAATWLGERLDAMRRELPEVG